MIPRNVLFGNPEKTSPELSPDGKKMAYLAPLNGVLNVWVRTIGENDDRPVTGDTRRGIWRYFWSEANDEILYLQDKDGNENWRLYGVDLGSKEVRDYTPYENVQVRVIEYNKHHSREMLVAMNKDDPKVHDVYYLDLGSKEIVLKEKNPGDVSGWLSDDTLTVRGMLRTKDDGGEVFFLRSPQNSWQELISWDVEEAATSGPLTFTSDGRYLYLYDSRGSDTVRLVKMDLVNDTFQTVARDKQYDLGGIMVHPDTYEVQAVTVHKARKEWIVLDETIKDDIGYLKTIDRGDMFLSSRDNADSLWIVGFIKDNGPVPFYLYDRGSKDHSLLFVHRPDLLEYELACTEPVSFLSRDGLTIHGYLTYPPDKKKKDLPAVLLVHGGPWSRDTWGYDPEVQWLANRGYAVLQVNYRGSRGYGKAFLNAGNKEWGNKMQNDLTDAVAWLISRGTVDPARIAVFGASYGGYAALAGAAFTPDLFCCAVDVVGPSNLISFIRSIPPYWSTFLATMRKRVGDPESEEDFLRSRSPLFKADQIKIPLLIAQGANDPRVNQAESEQIVEALKKNNVKYRYMLFPDEGHGFARPENRLAFYAAAEKFLADHLGGRYEK